MAYSVRANKVTTVEFDVQDLRSFLAEKAQEVLGNSENGYDRKIEMEPMFVVQHGEATLSGIRMIVTDTYLAEHG
jgi:hypothetical protein